MSGGVAAVFAERYRVARRLGAGGSGAVFLARDERLSRDVAVKRLHGAEVTAETAQRLGREARIMAALRHPGLVTVYDMLTDRGRRAARHGVRPRRDAGRGPRGRAARVG